MEHGNITVIELLRSGVQGIAIAGFTPVDTQHKIYRVGDILHWNGAPVGSSYTLPTATAGTLGGIRVGPGLSIDGSGALSVNTTSVILNTNSYPAFTWDSPQTATIRISGLMQASGIVALSMSGTPEVSWQRPNNSWVTRIGSDGTWFLAKMTADFLTRSDAMVVSSSGATVTSVSFPELVSLSKGLQLVSGTPSVTTNKLYNISGVLHWNGTPIGGSVPGNMVTTDTTQSITGTKTFDSVLTVNNRAVFASTMSMHGSVNTIQVTANHDQSTGAAWALTAATRFRSGAGAASDAKGHTSFTTFQDSVGVASTGMSKARGFYAVAAQNDATNSSCGTYYGYSTLTGSGAGVTTFATYASFAVDDETYANVAFANRYGLLVKTGSVVPSTSWYGVYIEDGPASPTRFSIYTGTAPSRFGGGVELPSFTPSSTANRLYNVSGALYWNGTPLQSRLTTTSEAPSANLSMTSSWVNRHTRIAPTTILNVVVEPGIANVSDEIQILQENTNFFVLTAGSGVTLRCATSQTTIQPRAQYSCLRLICVAANTYDVIGDFVP